ncbi:hypothetical protein JCM10212_003267 [Sporobolomyces blumeae]
MTCLLLQGTAHLHRSLSWSQAKASCSSENAAFSSTAPSSLSSEATARPRQPSTTPASSPRPQLLAQPAQTTVERPPLLLLLPLPLPSRSDVGKRLAPSSPEHHAQQRKKPRASSSPVSSPQPPRASAPLKRKAPPVRPPPLPLRASFDDFVLCANFRTPTVQPSSQYRTPSPFLASSPVTSTVRADLASSPPLPPPQSSSFRRRPIPRRRHPDYSDASLDEEWSFLDIAVRDRIHLADAETLNGERDDWAPGAAPKDHKIRSIARGPGGRLLASSPWVVHPFKIVALEPGHEHSLPSAWDTTTMRKTEARLEREAEVAARRREARRREKGKAKMEGGTEDGTAGIRFGTSGSIRSTSEQRQTADDGTATTANGAGEGSVANDEDGTKPKKKQDLIRRLKSLFDVDEEFSDDDELQAYMNEIPAVGFAALAKPVIRKERDRRKTRRELGLSSDDDSD